ncbi:hypothetical protein KR200_002530 [Drosophila serrata]|nr:hypothetical protein KR200_002530 [Drosophila serrata]
MHCVVGMLCLLALGATAAPTATSILADLPKCAATDDQLGECVKEIFNTLTPRLKDGNPELKIPPYEPFNLNRTSFQYTSGNANGRITVRNAKIYGFSANKAKDVSVKVSKDKVKLRLVTYMPKLNIVGTYKADLQVNQLQLKPKGDFNVTLKDVETTTLTDGEIYTKEGHRYFRLKNIDTKPKIGDLVIKANGIFADPELDQIALNVANQYWRDIYGIMLPETRQYWQPLVLRMFNEALELVPIDQFLPEEQS